MLEHSGSNLKSLASAFFIVGVITSVICAIMLWIANTDRNPTVLSGFLVLVLGSFVSWVSSLVLHAFGEIAENTEATVALLSKLLDEQNQSAQGASSEKNASTTYNSTVEKLVCPNCGYKNSRYATLCSSCGHAINTSTVRKVQVAVRATSTTEMPSDKKKCPHCAAWNKLTNETCFACGEKLDN